MIVMIIQISGLMVGNVLNIKSPTMPDVDGFEIYNNIYIIR